jgi:hypothetical protein
MTKPSAQRSCDVAVPAGRRRRRVWLGVTLAAVFVAGLSGWCAPHLACLLLRWRTPLETEVVVLRGAAFGSRTAAPAMIIGRCSPATLQRIIEGASGRWLPRILLRDGQQVWGTFAEVPDVTWRLEVDDTASEPVITGRLPRGIVERVVAGYLERQRAPLSQVTVQGMRVSGEPRADRHTAWQVELGGSAQVYLWEQSLPISVEHLDLALTTTLTQQPTRGYALSAQVTLNDLRGTTPLGALAPLMPTVQAAANRLLTQELVKVVVPGWWPSATHWDLQVVADGRISEF